MTDLTTLRAGERDARRLPGDTYRLPMAWQLSGGPGDGRWGVQATRYEYMNAQCRYCGNHCDGPANSIAAHPRITCLACATPQCDGHSRTCRVCMIGWLRPTWGQSTVCGYAQCGKPAVADAPRVGRACRFHLTKARSRGQTLDDQIANSLRLRDLGGLSWQKLAWFGPAKRYAVRRWHDDGRSGWVTGQDPQGFETAGRADREAAAWNDPRISDGWHGARAELTPETWAQIREQYPEPAAGRECAACGDPVEDDTSELCDSCTTELAEED